MLIFPFLQLTWRESIVGFAVTEPVYMQVEHNWVFSSKPGFRGYSAGQAMGENLGSVKWAMSDTTLNGKRLRVLHSESTELKTFYRQIEDVIVDPATNQIVRQNEMQESDTDTIRSTSTFFADHIENRRVGRDGKAIVTTIVPPHGMDEVQRRFQPLLSGSKTFQSLNGITGQFHEVKVEKVGRFTGNWGVDKYEGYTYRFTYQGHEQTVMLTKYGEIVKITLAPEYSLALMSVAKSRRYKETATVLLP